MKTIGFIDYHLNEWHANNYPRMITDLGGGEFQVTLAYGHIRPEENEAWSKEHNIPLAKSIEEVVEQCDCLVVLSPDNPEMHIELSRLPLQSGKRVYIDKTFAQNTNDAKTLFAMAKRGKTPVYSCSSLNFAEELSAIEKSGIACVRTIWAGGFHTHLIHQIEPLIVLMGQGAERVMCVGSRQYPTLVLEFPDGRTAISGMGSDAFTLDVDYTDGHCVHKTITSPYFDKFIQGMLNYFKTGRLPVKEEQTMAVMATLEACMAAGDAPYTWVKVAL